MDTLYDSSGPLRYSRTEDGGYKLIVEVDQDLADYYRALVPKWFDIKRGRYDAHITVVRCYKEIPVNVEPWDKYQGEEVHFQYSPIVNYGKTYFWLNAFCSRLEEVRKELGLPVSSIYTRPPEGYMRCWHITLGNSK